MLKFLGMILIFGGSVYGGFQYAEKFIKRTQQLKELQRSVHQLQNEIVYTHTSLPDAINNISKKSIYPINSLFEYISSKLYRNEVDNVYEAFNKAIILKKNLLNLEKEDTNVLLDLAKTLGESDIEGQKRIFSLTLNNLNKQILLSEEIMNKNVKMYRYLGFTIGAAIVIMLV